MLSRTQAELAAAHYGELKYASDRTYPVSRTKIHAAGHALGGLAALRLDVRLAISGERLRNVEMLVSRHLG